MTRRGRRTDATPAPGAPVRGRRLWVSGAVVALLVTLGTVLFFLSQPAGASRVLADGTRIRFLGTSGPIGTDLILGSRLEGWLLRPEPAPAAQPALPRSLLRRSVLNSDRLVQSVTPLPSPRTFTGIPGLAGPRAASGRPRAVALRTTQDPGGLTIWCWLEGPSPGSPSSRRTNGRPDAELVRPIPLVAEVVDEAGRSGWSWPGSVRYGASLGRTNRECLVASWVPWYPRRSRILRLRLHRPARRGSGPLAEFRIPNPAAQTYPRWTPTPLPARARNGPLQVALERLSVAREEPTRGIWFSQTVVEVTFRVEGPPEGQREWDVVGLTFQDATGNATSDLLPLGIPSPDQVRRLRDGRLLATYRFPGDALLGEATVRVRAEFSRARAVPPVRPDHSGMLTRREGLGYLGPDRSLQRAVESAQLSGFPFALRLSEQEGARLALLELWDAAGRPLPFQRRAEPGRTWEEAPCHGIMGSSRPVRVRVGFYRSRFLQWTVATGQGKQAGAP